MKILAALAVSAVGAFAPLAAVDYNLFYLGGGLMYLSDHGTRDEFDGDGGGNRKYGWHAAAGVSAPAMGAIGQPWLDFDWNRQEHDGNRIDTFGVLYAERAQLSESFYLGFGLGSYYNDLRIEEPTGVERTRRWRVGGKLLAGLRFGTIFLEGAYQYVPSVIGAKPSAYTLKIGFLF